MRKYSIEVTKRFIEEMDRVTGRHLTDQKFGELVGVPSSNIVRMRKGGGYVTIDALCRMVEVFGTDPVWLLTGVKQEKKASVRKLIPILF